MGKIRPGNKQNSAINGEYAKHVRKRTGIKQITSGKRRAHLKRDTDQRLDKDTRDQYQEDDDMN
jgi:hypothetical protein